MRVARIVTRPNLGGPMRQAIALWHAHRQLGIATLLVTGVVGAGEAALEPSALGVPRLPFADAVAAGPAAAGWVELADLQRGVAPWRDLRAGRALRRLLAAFAADVVHTHTSKAGWLGRRAAFALGVPRVVHTFHGHVLQDYFGGPMSALLRRLERRLAARTDVLVAVSDSCADELAAAGIAPRQRFVVVPPAVPLPAPLARAEARRRLGLGEAVVALACVGRLVPIKRVADFVDAVAARPTWRGVVFGDGPDRAALAQRVAARAAGRIELAGAVPDAAALLPAFDALVLPSVREGCPLVAVEAFAAGVPVVGYDVPGVRDALTVWGDGFLVPPAEGPDGLGAAIARCLAEPAATAARVRRARDGVGRFAPAQVAAALVDLYRPGKAGVARYDAAAEA
ncbi:MAG: glycosyltransferase family 4 protein [Planctomycetes bacterium]|nr:glycosyltransferase family 4 protein [Planctomycetota bacterium]